MLTIGTYLADRYEIINKIGAGGMSDVYKAKDHILGRFVAIKVLKQEFSEDRTFVTKFRTEAQSAAGLEHPNIVNIYDVGSEGSLHYIVMEYVEGITLKTYIEKKVQLSFKEAISIAIQVGRGIEVAHNKNIVHRDIKPQNIIISTEGKVKVTDFGIARAASANTISSDVMGSVHYSSPEQARNGYVDNRSDIYSLGIVMFEMVTGRVPFDGDTTVAVAIQHLQEEMPLPSSYVPDIPVSIEKIILKCSQKSPERRYQSMAELLTDLRKALVNPNEDFVVITSLADTGKTKVMSAEDLEEIKGKSSKVRVEEDEEEEEEKPSRKRSRFFDEDDEDDDEEEEDERPRRHLFFGGDDDDDDEDEDFDEDDDEEGGLNPKMDKIVTIAGIVVAAIIVIVIIIFILNISGILKGRKHQDTNTETETQTETMIQTETQEEEVEMINLVGMDQEEAQEALSKMGLILFVKMEESDEKEGTILSQDIEKGEKLKKGDTVNVVVAAAQETVEVPVVTGLSESEAVRTIEGLKLLATKKYQYSDTVAAGNVISQSPSAGSSALPKSKVELVISQGVESVIVPNVTGMASATAQSQLSQAGLIAQIVEDYSDTVAAGNVISQDVAANKTVAKNTQVTIVVSKGPATVMYKFQYTVGSNAVPANATKADIVVTDSNGNVIISWNKTDIATVKGGTFSKNNIAGVSSGKVTVTWYGVETQTAADGTTSEVEVKLEGGISDTITFDKQ